MLGKRVPLLLHRRLRVLACGAQDADVGRQLRLICVLLTCTCGVMLSPSSWAVTEDLKIPNLGESSTSLFSADYEYQLGRMWLRSFRGQAPLLNDPLMHSYLENLVFELVQHSELQDRRIELVIVDNPTINAFAVPGGVIGVHSGLFQYAETEGEFATVYSCIRKSGEGAGASVADALGSPG